MDRMGWILMKGVDRRGGGGGAGATNLGFAWAAPWDQHERITNMIEAKLFLQVIASSAINNMHTYLSPGCNLVHQIVFEPLINLFIKQSHKYMETIARWIIFFLQEARWIILRTHQHKTPTKSMHNDPSLMPRFCERCVKKIHTCNASNDLKPYTCATSIYQANTLLIRQKKCKTIRRISFFLFFLSLEEERKMIYSLFYFLGKAVPTNLRKRSE
jgi:hypothetical protein